MTSLTTMTRRVLEQASEVNSLVDRLRRGNRRVKGSTGEMPTPMDKVERAGDNRLKVADEPPLLVSLDNAIELLNSATADLRAEVGYFESYTETGEGPSMPKSVIGSTGY